MANKKYEETDIQAIADTIREKTGSEDSFKVRDMASGVSEVYEAGKKSEYDEFWDAFQDYGKGRWGAYVFSGKWWNDITFYPKYDIKPGGGASGYYFYNNIVTNLRERIDGRGLKIIIPNGNTLQAFFRGAQTVEAPDFDTSPSKVFTQTYYQATRLVTIPRVNISNATDVTNMFVGATSLQNVTFEGEIPLSLSFADCPLSVASLKNIITHLKDYSADTANHYAYTVTFLTSAFEALEAEGATAEYNGVACTWTELIDNLKWNLVKA